MCLLQEDNRSRGLGIMVFRCLGGRKVLKPFRSETFKYHLFCQHRKGYLEMPYLIDSLSGRAVNAAVYVIAIAVLQSLSLSIASEPDDKLDRLNAVNNIEVQMLQLDDETVTCELFCVSWINIMNCARSMLHSSVPRLISKSQRWTSNDKDMKAEILYRYAEFVCRKLEEKKRFHLESVEMTSSTLIRGKNFSALSKVMMYWGKQSDSLDYLGKSIYCMSMESDPLRQDVLRRHILDSIEETVDLHGETYFAPFQQGIDVIHKLRKGFPKLKDYDLSAEYCQQFEFIHNSMFSVDKLEKFKEWYKNGYSVEPIP